MVVFRRAGGLGWLHRDHTCFLLHFGFLPILVVGNPQEVAKSAEKQESRSLLEEGKAADSCWGAAGSRVEHWALTNPSTFVWRHSIAWGLMWCRETSPAASDFLTGSPAVELPGCGRAVLLGALTHALFLAMHRDQLPICCLQHVGVPFRPPLLGGLSAFLWSMRNGGDSCEQPLLWSMKRSQRGNWEVSLPLYC